jgi:hypothetical protein
MAQDTVKVFAKAVLKEVPLTDLQDFIRNLGNPVANGNGCGNACGNNCVRTIEQFANIAKLPVEQLNAIVSDKTGLQKEIGKQLQKLTLRMQKPIS